MKKSTHRGGWRILLIIISGVGVSAVAIFVVAQVFIYSTNVEGTCKSDIFRPAAPEPSGVVIRGDGDTNFTNGPTLCPAGQYGNDNILGTAGRDTLSGDSGDEDPQAQIRTGRDSIYGQAGDDLLDGETGNDALFSGPGSDVLKGGPGKDLLDGGEGNDILEGGPGSDRLLGQEGNDFLLGDEDNDTLIGGPGDDELDGGPGSDILNGGLGSDQLIGGLGNDIFQFQADDIPKDSEEMILCTEHHAESGIIYLQQGAFRWDGSIPVRPMEPNTELIINASSGGTIRVLAGPGTCYVRFRKG